MSVIVQITPTYVSTGQTVTSTNIFHTTELRQRTHDEDAHTYTPLERISPIQTHMHNMECLLKTLNEMGFRNIVQKGDQVFTDLFTLSYTPDSEKQIVFDFITGIQIQDAEKFVQELQLQYGKQLQEAVYTRLKEKAQAKGLQLEQEYIEEDDTIVLTYNVE